MSIVVGYLATDEGEAALARALAEAVLRSEDLVVVLTPGSSDPEGGRERIEALRASLDGEAIGHRIIDPSDPEDSAESLIAASEEYNASLIVIGLRKRNPVGKLILGANAQRILLDAACPVLAVKSAAR